MTLYHYLGYLSLLIVATIIPGPNVLLAFNHGVNYGIGKTLYSGLGNLAGNLLMAFLSFLGLGVVLLKAGILFSLIKWAGVLYLIYLGIRMILAPVESEETAHSKLKTEGKKGFVGLFIEGFCTAVSNPKGILFFTALFPQFITAGHSSWSNAVLILLPLGIVVFGCYVIYGLLGLKLQRLFYKKSFRRIFNRISGSLMIGIGLTIGFSK